MRRARGMDDQALRVAHVGEVRPEAYATDELLTALESARTVEREDRARAAGQVLLDERPIPASGKAGIGDVCDAVVSASSTCRSIRRDNVSSPCRKRNGLNSESAPPRSRSVSARSFIR